MFCKHCGSAIRQEDKFCPACGGAVTPTDAVPYLVYDPDRDELISPEDAPLRKSPSEKRQSLPEPPQEPLSEREQVADLTWRALVPEPEAREPIPTLILRPNRKHGQKEKTSVSPSGASPSDFAAPQTFKPEPDVTAPQTFKPESDVVAPQTFKPEPDIAAPQTFKPEPDIAAPQTFKPESDVAAPQTFQPVSDVATSQTSQPEPDVVAPQTSQPEPDVVAPQTFKPESEMDAQNLTPDFEHAPYVPLEPQLAEKKSFLPPFDKERPSILYRGVLALFLLLFGSLCGYFVFQYFYNDSFFEALKNLF